MDCHKFFSEAVHNDIDIILNDIREAHKNDMMPGNPSDMAAHLDAAYENAADKLPGTWEQAAYMFCAKINVDYDRLDDGQKKSLLSILKKSDMLQNTINQRDRY